MRSFRRLRARAGRKGSTSPISCLGQRRERRAAKGGTTKRRIRAGGQPKKPAHSTEHRRRRRTIRQNRTGTATGAHARTGRRLARNPRNRNEVRQRTTSHGGDENARLLTRGVNEAPLHVGQSQNGRAYSRLHLLISRSFRRLSTT